eukprot:TRINITY_DN7367_c0_g1_i1.p1 TRINITY_DN7367_c0_g1~~TRINITY_DN7367_c0_g1_i1.p1  ORF type:complete len:405 (-),score=101.33 TRINITY_DN7367_c0_g1_i1:120-1334(-)
MWDYAAPPAYRSPVDDLEAIAHLHEPVNLNHQLNITCRTLSSLYRTSSSRTTMSSSTYSSDSSSPVSSPLPSPSISSQDTLDEEHALVQHNPAHLPPRTVSTFLPYPSSLQTPPTPVMPNASHLSVQDTLVEVREIGTNVTRMAKQFLSAGHITADGIASLRTQSESLRAQLESMEAMLARRGDERLACAIPQMARARRFRRPKQTPPNTPAPSVPATPQEDEGTLPVRGKRKSESHSCTACGTTSSPEWRRGPQGSNTLCNACGLHYAKLLKKGQGDLMPQGIGWVSSAIQDARTGKPDNTPSPVGIPPRTTSSTPSTQSPSSHFSPSTPIPHHDLSHPSYLSVLSHAVDSRISSSRYPVAIPPPPSSSSSTSTTSFSSPPTSPGDQSRLRKGGMALDSLLNP